MLESVAWKKSRPSLASLPIGWSGTLKWILFTLLGLVLSAHAHAQSCSSWYMSNFHNAFSTAPEGPYSTPIQACTAYDWSYIYPSGATTTGAFSLGPPAGNNGYPAGSYYCSEVINDTLGTTYIQESAYVAEPRSGCTNLYYAQAAIPRAQASCRDCVADPINPGVGNVFETETDVRFAGSGAIAYQRFYNSADVYGSDGVPGWRHSYDRNITVLYAPPAQPYPGASATVSSQYASPSAACTSGFAAIQGAVGAWAGATASYNNGICTLSNSTGALGTLPVFGIFTGPANATPFEYDVTRDDGQVLRFPVSSGVITTSPGVSMRLAVTASGFAVTDDEDNVETYNSTGALQSVTSRAGIVQTIAYDTNGLFLSATDSFGNSLTVTRDPVGSISQIALSGGGTVQYGYDFFLRLLTVTNLDGTTRSYQYGNANFANALTAEVDESGTTFSTWTYNGQEQATATQEAGGAGTASIAYNADGTVTVTDALGSVRTFTYTRVGDINRPVAISGSQCSTCEATAATTYDSAGWVSSRTDYDGNVICYANDPVRGLELARVEGFAPGSTCPANLTSYLPAAGTTQRKISTTWSTGYRLPALITEANRTTGFGYDSAGNLLTKTVTDTTTTPNASRVWTYTYNSYGQVLTATGPRTDINSTRTYTYYNCSSGSQCGQIQTVADELGHVTTFNTYNAYGQPLKVTDPNNVVTTLTYDARQRLSSRSIAGETTGISYYPTGLVHQVTLPDGSFLKYTYDGAQRLTQITDSLGNRVVYTLDALGNHTSESLYDPSSALTRTRTQVFNTLSELSEEIGSAGTSAVTTSFGYDSNGNQTSVSAPLARNTSNQYDALNRLRQITDPAGGVTTLSYDTRDNLIAVVDPRNLTTGYSYNGFGDLIQQTSPDTGITINAYDSGGNVATTQDARSQTGTYTYDAQNRVTQIAYADQTIAFGYDAGPNGIGRLTSATDANHSLTWSYDALARVTGKTQTVGTGASAITKSVGYSYTNGDLTSLVTPSGQTVAYGYTNGQVTSISVNGGALLSQVLYEPFGPISGWTWGNNTNEARVYDEDGNLTGLESAEGFTYSYDNAFRITGIADNDNGVLSQTYGYDTLDRLTAATGTSLNESWTYDANGNRKTQAGASPSTYTVSATSNRIASISGGLTRTYAYTPSGQTTSYGGLTFNYMDSGRLSSVSSGSATTTYVLNALGQRVKKSGTAVTLFVYDESGHLLGEYDGSGNLIEETIWMGDVPVATLRPNGTGVSVYYIHTDHLNTPRRISRPADNVIVWRWDSEPFGVAAANQDPDGDGTQFIYNPRFPGQYYDAETELNYNYFRDYDPATGRYVKSDPIGLLGGINSYAYVDGNPVSEVDPLGLLGMDDVYGAIYNATGGWSPSQGLVDYTAGFGDAASLGATSLIRNAMGTNDAVNKCSKAYSAGGWTSLALGSGRLAYAGLAKGYSIVASSGAAASAFRSGLRVAFGGGASLRPPDLTKYATDAALRAAAGRTNPFVNAYGAAIAAKGAAEGSSCGCSQ